MLALIYMTGAIVISIVLSALVGLGGVGASDTLFFIMTLMVTAMIIVSVLYLRDKSGDQREFIKNMMFVVTGNAFILVSIVFCSIET